MLLRPNAAAADKYIGRTLTDIGRRRRPDVSVGNTDDDRVAVDTDMFAKMVVAITISNSEFLLLGPSNSAAGKNVRGSLIGADRAGMILGTRDERVAVDRNLAAELVPACSVGSCQFLLLCSNITAAGKDIH